MRATPLALATSIAFLTACADAPNPTESVTPSASTVTTEAYGFTNEPAGMTVLSQWDASLAGRPTGWYRMSTVGQIADQYNEPFTPATALQLRFSANHPGGSGGGKFGFGQGAPTGRPMARKEVFVGYTWMATKPWDTGQGSKHFYIRQWDGGRLHATVFFAMNAADGTDSNVNGPWTTKICAERVGGRCYYGDSPRLTADRWHKIEVYVKKSSSDGAADGVIRWWIDGQLAGNVPNAKVGAELWDEVAFDAIWSSTSKYRVNSTQYMRFGHFRISGR
jgi:hypothetical protein